MKTHSSFDFSERNWDSLQFRLIFALSFAIHLMAAVGARFTPHHWSGAATRRSVFSEAWEASGTTAEIACSG